MTKSEIALALLEERLRHKDEEIRRLTDEIAVTKAALRMSEVVRHQLVTDDIHKTMGCCLWCSMKGLPPSELVDAD